MMCLAFCLGTQQISQEFHEIPVSCSTKKVWQSLKGFGWSNWEIKSWAEERDCTSITAKMSHCDTMHFDSKIVPSLRSLAFFSLTQPSSWRWHCWTKALKDKQNLNIFLIRTLGLLVLWEIHSESLSAQHRTSPKDSKMVALVLQTSISATSTQLLASLTCLVGVHEHSGWWRFEAQF